MVLNNFMSGKFNIKSNELVSNNNNNLYDKMFLFTYVTLLHLNQLFTKILR